MKNNKYSMTTKELSAYNRKYGIKTETIKKERNRTSYDIMQYEQNKEEIEQYINNLKNEKTIHNRTIEEKIKNAEHARAYYKEHHDEELNRAKTYRDTHKEESKDRNKRFFASDRGKQYSKIRRSFRRDLGYECLNEFVEGYEGHHINKEQVVFMPKELHRLYSHDHKRPETMIEVNRIAMKYVFNCNV